MNTYIYISTIIFAVFALVWTSNTWHNVITKVIFFAMVIAGIVLSLESLGYIIQQ